MELPKGVLSIYHGKVRDVFFLENHKILMVCSDRISAFDHLLPQPIPCKGAILNQLSGLFLQQTAAIFPNWLEQVVHPQAALGKKCLPIRIEMVVRGHLSGHAWRTYQKGLRTLCGVPLPEGMIEHQPFPEPILTPALKVESGHDMDISRDEILRFDWMPEDRYLQMEQASLKLFAAGQEHARKRGLLLLDTKYEFGLFQGELMLMDEIHTPDSSRYVFADGFEPGKKANQLSKEFVREWLMGQGFQGLEGQSMPNMSLQDAWNIREQYRNLFLLLTGKDPICREPLSTGELLDLIQLCLETS